VWLCSPLGIRSDALPSDFTQAILYLKNALDVSGFKLFLNTLWALWKARCSYVYEWKQLSPNYVVRVATELSQTGLTLPRRCLPRTLSSSPISIITPNVISCFVDGSYSHATDGGHGRAAMVMKKGDEMIEYTAQPFLAISALHSEVRAVSLAVQALQSANLNHAVIVTDCKQLSEAISAKDFPINLDWRLYSENFQVWLFVKDNSGISCVFMGREHNIEAH
jgi:Reverse transcriptase-like